ncbi:hypothetical protein O7606_13010 [Micromonospora sp. WMMD882]|uniref:hypothetical protein n=1 Tax=Micromonospora sp. WMMD882 TaxID=3015151 RepID=UPI00248AFFA9|nr:hypothetical protein [Micromonospora sp. WMMD882]WBB82198.1 hypothetical protein O7606_13010 [Micromonospora sp. WMMD882]
MGEVRATAAGSPRITAGPGKSARPRRAAGARQAQQWLLTLLPAFPVLLLVLRLWQLSRQDMSTMLLLVQYVSPLGMLSALLIALVWAGPLAVLVVGVLGRLLRLSAPERFDPERSLLASGTARTPGWVLTGAVVLAALTWQLRFLPTLLMLALWLLALRTRYLYPEHPTRLLLVGTALPVAAGVLTYAVLGPAVWAAATTGEWTTAVLLAVPPAAGPVLTGPIPGWIAPALTHGLAYTVAAALPLVMGAVFLRVPVLPDAAVEVAATDSDQMPDEVALGQLITMTDTATVLLDQGGTVRFLPNGRVRTQTLCPEVARAPFSVVSVHGWPVEETTLDWMTPRRPVAAQDPRCAGRPAGGS